MNLGMTLAEDRRAMGVAANESASEADALVRQYREPLKRFFQRRLRDRTEAEDLAHEVLLKLARQNSFAHQPRPAYIFLTARSVLLDKVRRNRVRERVYVLEENHEAAMEVPSAERVYSAQERVARVEKFLEALTPRVREVFTMHRVEGLAYSEIAQALGITMSTVEKHMSSALRFLMQHADEIEG
jgi:RNA polymerase sigma-70 factor (ECF subfamily)